MDSPYPGLATGSCKLRGPHGEDLDEGLRRGSFLQVVTATRERKSHQASELDKDSCKHNSSFCVKYDTRTTSLHMQRRNSLHSIE
ncbi:hypothetical protein TNCV_1801081 [Trichonephila clavipes]|nr:hypothetical protein TNCV_1801081 [Trichonephila clavipes]